MTSHSIEIDKMGSSVFVNEKIAGVKVSVTAFELRKLMEEGENFPWCGRMNRFVVSEGVSESRKGTIVGDKNRFVWNEFSLCSEKEWTRSINASFVETKASSE